MKLVLALTGPPRLMGARNRCELRSGSLTIGRSPEADWVIPDTDRAISRRHLRIDASHGDFVLTDTSSNGVYVNANDVPVGYGASVTLRDGDDLRVGEARISVTIESASDADLSAPKTASVSHARFAASRMPANPVRDPLGGPFGELSSSDIARSPSVAEPPKETPRRIIDANWMIEPASDPRPTLRSHGNGTMASPGHVNGHAALANGPPPNRPPAPPTLVALVERHPGLSARRLAEAVDAATQTMDASARQALHHKINLIVG